MKLKPLFAMLGCTAAVLVCSSPSLAMGIVDGTARQQASVQQPQRQPPPQATAVASTVDESSRWRDSEAVLVAIAAMALAARGIAARMR